MVSRGVFYLVTAILFIVGISLMIYQHLSYEVPFSPGVQRQMWTLEAKIEFEPNGAQTAKVYFALPAIQPGFTQLTQTSASIGFGSSYIQKNNHPYIEWTKRNPIGLQTLYYRADFLTDSSSNNSSMTVPELVQNIEPEPYATAMAEIADAAHKKSADPYSFTVQVINQLAIQSDISSLLLSKYDRATLIKHILDMAQIPSRVIGVLDLEDGRRNRDLSQKIAVFDGTNYEVFDPITGQSGIKENQLIWINHDDSLLDVQGGTNARVSFSIIKNQVPAVQAGLLKANAKKASGDDLVSLSIINLPIEEQSLFKGILLLPIGVLVVVFLRVLIGLKTSGTFMPVLIAMAFLQTSLLVGLIGFISIVCIGLVVRSWLSHLNLLLVARISAVIITVIGIIGFISLITYKIGLTEGIKVTFFPMIILSWTIERMSILWEEEGYKEVLKQGGGSLFVAVCAFLAMNSALIQHLTFNFLGLQLVILSIVLLIGNYTGFKLTELKRFKPLVAQIKLANKESGAENEAQRLANELKEIKSNPHETMERWSESENKDNKEDPK